MTDFLGGALPTPAERLEPLLRKELERRRGVWPNDTLYKGGGDLLLRHGRFYPGRRLPEAFHHLIGAPQQCFVNAIAVAEAEPDLFYCEGVYSSGTNHFTGHAWCVNRKYEIFEVTAPPNIEDYNVPMDDIDNGGATLPFLPFERWGYWGVVIDTDLVKEIDALPILDRADVDRELHERGAVGLADDRTSWPILEQAWQPPRGF